MYFPSNNAYAVPATPADYTRSQMASDLNNQLAATKQLIGASAVTCLVIDFWSILPTSGVHTVDTSGNAIYQKQVNNINYNNLPDGSLLLLSIENEVRPVTFVHNAGGLGQLLLANSTDVTLTNTSEYVLLQRRGSLWRQITFQMDSQHQIDQDNSITILNWFVRKLVGGSDDDGVFAYGPIGQVSLTVSAKSPASMRITVSPGAGYCTGKPFRISNSVDSGLLVPPTTQARVDSVTIIAATGCISIHAGSPYAPPAATGEVLLAWIHHRVGETCIRDTDNGVDGWIEDKRTFLNA